MTATLDYFRTDYEAYVTWQEALAAYWEMIEELRMGQQVDSASRERMLAVLDGTHTAWMRAGEPLSRTLQD